MVKSLLIKDYTVVNVVCDYLKNNKKISPCIKDTITFVTKKNENEQKP